MSAAGSTDVSELRATIAEQRERIKQLERALEADDSKKEIREAVRNSQELRALIDTANAPIFGTDTKGLVSK